MNRKMKRMPLLLVIVAIVAQTFGCGMKEDIETTVSVKTTVPTEAATTEATISPELQKALDEGWIEEDWPEETTEATEETKPEETKPEETHPQETKPQETNPTETKPENKPTAYEEYMAMTPEQQQAFFQSFDSVDAYFTWLNNAKAEYEEKQNATDLEGGSVDLGTMPK